MWLKNFIKICIFKITLLFFYTFFFNRNLKRYVQSFWIGANGWSLTLSDKAKLRLFEDMMYRRILNEDERRQKHNDKLLELFNRPYIVQTLKQRRLIWARYVVRRGSVELITRSWWINYLERDRWLGQDASN